MQMNLIRQAWLLLLIPLMGCSGKEKLDFVHIEGTLMLDGKPLPLALVEFMPELKGYGAEMNSTAVTDAKGKFVLVRGAEPGTVIGTHRVVVNEGPPPAGTRGQDAASQTKLGEYMRALTNRPIPEKFGNYAATPARAVIKEENKNLIVELKR